jgi:hypothetical protein
VRVHVLLELSCRITSLATELACFWTLQNVQSFHVPVHVSETVTEESAAWNWTRNFAHLVLQHVCFQNRSTGVQLSTHLTRILLHNIAGSMLAHVLSQLVCLSECPFAAFVNAFE